MNNLKENVTKLIAKHGITISKLEKALGFGNATIRDWEFRSPSVEKVERVADYFHVSVDSLLGREHKKSELDILYERASAEDKAVIDLLLSKYKKADIENLA